MVKLVTSRVHRCYSSVSGMRSARNERLNDMAHLVAVTLLLWSTILGLPYLTGSTLADRQTLAVFGTGILTLVQLVDMYAISTAHRMFYQSPRQVSKRKPLLESPTKIDGLVSAFLLVASLAAFFAVRFPGTPKNVAFGQRVAVLANSMFLLATYMNSVVGVPLFAVKISGYLSRLHSAVVSLFLVGATANLVLAAIAASSLRSGPLKGILTTGSVVSYALIWVGSAGNCARVTALLAKHRRDGDLGSDFIPRRKPTGFFSWFKTSKSDNDGDSDFESDEFDEEEGYSSDGGRDDRKWRR